MWFIQGRQSATSRYLDRGFVNSVLIFKLEIEMNVNNLKVSGNRLRSKKAEIY